MSLLPRLGLQQGLRPENSLTNIPPGFLVFIRQPDARALRLHRKCSSYVATVPPPSQSESAILETANRPASR